jgi:hypothetical protein
MSILRGIKFFRQLLVICMTLGCIITFPFNGYCDDYNFRKTKWGMSMQQVKESEPLEIDHSNDKLLRYKSIALDKNVYIIYGFVDDKLFRARYVLAEGHSNNNDYIDDYNAFKNILTTKYGKPIYDKVIWKTNLYKRDPQHWGLAIALGHLSYFSKWIKDDTEIVCALMGDNNEITCGVEYQSIKLLPLEKSHKEKKALENF